MSEKRLDAKNRWRNVVVAFRMSPEEDELLETAVRLSGLTKQEYIIRRLQEKEVVVTIEERIIDDSEDDDTNLVERAPVVVLSLIHI